MRKWKVCALMMTLALLVTACGGKDSGRGNDELALDIRTAYIAMESCTATMEVTADYGERVYDYTIDLNYLKDGETVLTVTAPEDIAGVTARISGGSAIMEYDGISLETGPLDSEGLSPVGAVPVLLGAVQTGYIAETGTEMLGEVDCLRVCYRDPEEKPGDGTEMNVWFNTVDNTLVRGEISAGGHTVVQCVFTAFSMS